MELVREITPFKNGVFGASVEIDLTKYGINTLKDAKLFVESSLMMHRSIIYDGENENNWRDYALSVCGFGEFEPTFSHKHHRRTVWRSREVIEHRVALMITSLYPFININDKPVLAVEFFCKAIFPSVSGLDIEDVYNHPEKYELVPRIVSTDINGFKNTQMVTIDLFRKETLMK